MGKCFDIVTNIMDTTSQIKSIYVEDKQRKSRLKDLCSKIDEVFEKTEGISYEAYVDEVLDEITIVLNCTYLEIYDTSDVFCDVIRHTKQFRFEPLSNDKGEYGNYMKICFVISKTTLDCPKERKIDER